MLNNHELSDRIAILLSNNIVKLDFNAQYQTVKIINFQILKVQLHLYIGHDKTHLVGGDAWPSLMDKKESAQCFHHIFCGHRNIFCKFFSHIFHYLPYKEYLQILVQYPLIVIIRVSVRWNCQNIQSLKESKAFCPTYNIWSHELSTLSKLEALQSIL